MNSFARKILDSRRELVGGFARPGARSAEEGGCGVVGFAASVPVTGRGIFAPSMQMHNRGNGKGGGIAAACLRAEQLGVDRAILRDDYILQIALLDGASQGELEQEFIRPCFEIHHMTRLDPVADYRDVGLEVRPPDIVRYFVRVRNERLKAFCEKNDLAGAPLRAVEDEFVYQNSFRLNRRFYASLGRKRAFVLSHARNLMIFKIVGYAEQVVKYYGLEDLEAQVWIAHQRYPTKGRVWHPAGSHPFIGMNEALVHNGDFANYLSISEYLRQHNIQPQFLTDTEVSVLLFDLWKRVYGYPLEYVIEAIAPTTELDFERLPAAKKKVYRAIQALHMHGSPDGPWFFIIARSDPDKGRFQLLGITDTSMLRPQVFAFQQGDVSIGLVASEKQAIDATLEWLSREDARFRPIADRYWNARGGSHTDGGAFAFTITCNESGGEVCCTDKFGRVIECPPGDWAIKPPGEAKCDLGAEVEKALRGGDEEGSFRVIRDEIASWGFAELGSLTGRIEELAGKGGRHFYWALGLLARLNDRRYNCGRMKRSVVLEIVRGSINSILDAVPVLDRDAGGGVRRIDWDSRRQLRPPEKGEQTLVINAEGFPAEGEHCDANLQVRAYQLGWRRFIVYRMKGQRFTGCGFGPATDGVRIDVFGSSGDYLGSGIDGMEIEVHDNAQDQVAQISKRGVLVVHGDVGQCFMYGAKGGEMYVLGNAAGRPLINAAGRPRVVINGTCLDFLAESFMAGDPHNGGGFVILNGIEFDHRGRVVPQESPYPGSNLFSLASGGAIFVRDPHKKLVSEQLNGGKFVDFEERDWQLILPYLQANERHFGIRIEEDLLTVDGRIRSPGEVYRKVQAVRLAVLAKEGVPE